eukprot:6201264-Pleurochrysis_carterae.AAC.2
MGRFQGNEMTQMFRLHLVVWVCLRLTVDATCIWNLRGRTPTRYYRRVRRLKPVAQRCMPR